MCLCFAVIIQLRLILWVNANYLQLTTHRLPFTLHLTYACSKHGSWQTNSNPPHSEERQPCSFLTGGWLNQLRWGSGLCYTLWTYCTYSRVWLNLIFNKCTRVPFESINLNLMSGTVTLTHEVCCLCVCLCVHHCRLSFCCFCSDLNSLCLLTCFGVKWGEKRGGGRPTSTPTADCCLPISWHVMQIVFFLTNEFRAHRPPFISDINSFALAFIQ